MPIVPNFRKLKQYVGVRQTVYGTHIEGNPIEQKSRRYLGAGSGAGLEAGIEVRVGPATTARW